MNNVQLIGRTTKEIEIRYTNNNKAVARFTLAVNRRSKDDGADFINCMAWEKIAELLEKYVKKGDRIAIRGRIQTGSYEKDGKKVYTTDIVVDELEFLESKKQDAPVSSDGFEPVNEQIDDELPFV